MLAPRAGRFLLPVGAALLLDLTVAGVLGFSTAYLELGLAGLLAALFAFFLVFFRDPNRPVGEEIVSAADGTVRAVEDLGDRWNVSVFMNVTNVHVNRFPIDGKVETIEAAGAGFRAAFRPEASRNVRRHYRLSTEIGPVEIVQITGVLARRLVSFVAAGSPAVRGERFGMIVLGSRVDVLFPSGRARPTVRVGDRVRAGVTTIARRTA